jgi:hypothetical protein
MKSRTYGIKSDSNRTSSLLPLGFASVVNDGLVVLGAS